jgi:alkaline phosphatase D
MDFLNAKAKSRRQFLCLCGSAVAALPLLHGLSGCATVQVPNGLEQMGLANGCAVGDVTPGGAVVWIRAQEESRVSVHYGRDPALKEFSATSPVRTRQERDFTAIVYLDDLQPKTTYYYRGAVDGKQPGPIGHFVTAPAPDEAADVRFAFSGDSRQSYQPFLIMDSIREMGPDFFLHLGDTIYADRGGIAKRLPQFWAKYAANRNDLPTQRLFSEASVYVLWDDHEVADNYDPDDPLAPIGRKAFFDYWPVRRSEGDPHRIYRSFRWGKAAELFILDTRQYRDYTEGTILGRKQKQWFLESLSASKAWFKMIATSVPFSSPNSDKWGGFPRERDQILRVIREQQISGVIFLTADVHYAAVSRIPGGLGLKEFIAGPLAAPMGVNLDGRARFEFFSRKFFSYGLVKVYARAPVPYVEIDLMNEKNKLLYRSRIQTSPA